METKANLTLKQMNARLCSPSLCLNVSLCCLERWNKKSAAAAAGEGLMRGK